MAKNEEPELPVPNGWEDNWQLAFPKEYLGAEHLRGHEVTLVISRVRIPEITFNKPGTRPRKERRLIIEFDGLKGRTDGTPWQWLLNKTNCRTIEALYGKAPRGWFGKRITLWADPDVEDPNSKVRGAKKEAIRVRPFVPEEKSQSRARGSAPTPQGAEPAPATGAPSEEEMQEIARREAEEAGR